MTCRCGRYDGTGVHPCHGKEYTCPEPGERRLIATDACLAGTQPKVGVYETWACAACFAVYQARLRRAKTPDGGAGLTGGAAVDTAALPAVAALDEVDARGPALVDGDHPDGLLFEIPRDRAGGALGLRVKILAAGGGSGRHQVDDDGGLALALPEAARLDVGRGREPDGDVLLHPACELRGVDGDGAPCGGERPQPATDQQRRPAGRHEGAEGSGRASGASTTASHGGIVSPAVGDPRDNLQQRVGRWPNRHWIYVEPQPDGRWLIEVSWIPDGVIMPEAGTRTPEGNLRFLVMPTELAVTRLFAAAGRAFLQQNGEV